MPWDMRILGLVSLRVKCTLATFIQTLAAMLTAELKHTQKAEWKTVQSLTATNSVFKNVLNIIRVKHTIASTLNQALRAHPSTL